jgi:hypothetical protein
MEPIKVTLCPACGHCPSVEIDDNGVRIGEEHNLPADVLTRTRE